MAAAVRPALPARPSHIHEAVPALPFHVTTPYARLLASDPLATGMEEERGCTMYNMVRFLRSLVEQGTPHTAAYGRLLELFEFASAARMMQQSAQEISHLALPAAFLAPAGHWMLKKLAKLAMQELQDKGRVLVPCYTLTHAMYLRIDQSGPGYRLRLYNTGHGLRHPDGTPRHTARGHGKWQTQYQVRGVRAGDDAGCLNARELLRLLRAPVRKVGSPESPPSVETVDDIYAWADALGTPHNPPRYSVQAQQKSGSCTHKSLLSVARDSLCNEAYCELLARLREQTYAEYVSRPHAESQDPLIALFARRVESARAKAEGARLQTALRDRHRGDAWMVESVDRGSMDRALIEARDRKGRAFMLSYRSDTHGFALSTADGSGLQHTPLVPRGGALTTPARTYADLRAAARYWRHEGYSQVGKAEVRAASTGA